MTHNDVVVKLALLYPNDEWSYDGDGTSFDPVTDSDGTLVSNGLVWHGPDPAPTWDAFVAAAEPVAVATASDHAQASASIITEKLAAVPVPRDQLAAILNQLLSEAVSAIPYYEGYTLTPDTATAWTNFQALDQPTKDRILYNACRSLAAIMRYLSGNLPA